MCESISFDVYIQTIPVLCSRLRLIHSICKSDAVTARDDFYYPGSSKDFLGLREIAKLSMRALADRTDRLLSYG